MVFLAFPFSPSVASVNTAFEYVRPQQGKEKETDHSEHGKKRKQPVPVNTMSRYLPKQRSSSD
jgi:hypothetical protein